MRFGSPLIAPAQSLVPGQADLLASNIAASAALTSFNVTAQNPYTAVLVHVHFPSSGPANPIAEWASVACLPGTFSGGFPSQPTVAALQVSDVQVMLSCVNSPGDVLTVSVQFSFAPLAGTLVTVYGLTDTPPPLCRPDGHNYPVGTFSAFVTTGLGTGAVLIAAPATGRVHLKSLHGAGVSGNTVATVTIGGIVSNLLLGFPPGTSNSTVEKAIPPDGLLLDPATAVNVAAQAGSTQEVIAIYDLVPT